MRGQPQNLSVRSKESAPEGVSVFCFHSIAQLRAIAGVAVQVRAVALAVTWLAAMNWPAHAELPHPLGNSGYLLHAWGTEDGLPENSATAIVQTQDGYLWFGTFNGLARFNGDSFTVFNPANTPQLPAAGIVNLHVDKRNRLWVSTTSGLVLKDGAQWRALGTNEGWPGNHIRTFSERGNGDLLITTFDGRVLAVENDRPTELPPPPGEPSQGYLGTVDENGQWWLTQNRFVGRWDGQRWIQVHAPSPAPGRSQVACVSARGGGVWVLLAKELLKFRGDSEVSRVSLPQLKGGIWSMTEDSRTNLWICSYDSGLFQITPDGNLRPWTTSNGLGSMSVRLVFEDVEENLWVGSSAGGLRMLTPRRFFDLDPGFGKVARSVWQSRDGRLWIAVFDGGLFRHDETRTARVLVPGPTNRSTYGLSVLEDRAGRLWYGDVDDCWWRSGQERFEKVPLMPSAANVNALFEDSQGRIWIANREGAVTYDGNRFQALGPEAGLPRGEIVCFGEDKSGLAWLAGSEGVFRQEQERFAQVRTADGQPLKGVLCFKADADGSMWMGTRATGLMRWRNGTMTSIGVEQGLPDQEVHGIIEDDQGYFWMTSNRGLLRASRQQLHAVADGVVSHLDFSLLDRNDGLPSVEFSTGQPACARDAAGRLYFATQKGVTVIDPASFRLNSHPPLVQVEQLTYRLAKTKPMEKGRRTSGDLSEVRVLAPFPKPLRVPHGSYGLNFEFAALSYSAPEKVRFEYRLEGMNQAWQDAGNLRFATFHHLPPGEYVFRVRAANNDGVWNETGASLAFAVLPYYWQSRWFGALIAMAAVGVAVVWYRQRIGKLEDRRKAQETFTRQLIGAQEAERARLARELHDDITQRLALLAIDTGRMERAGATPEVNDTMRGVREGLVRLSEDVHSLSYRLHSSLLEDLGLAEALKAECERFSRQESVRAEVKLPDLPPNLPNEVALCLFRIAQEALRNVARHARARTVDVTLRAVDGGLQLAVRDNGVGFDPKRKREHISLGLASMRERAGLLGGELDIESAPGYGTTIVAWIPLKEPKA